MKKAIYKLMGCLAMVAVLALVSCNETSQDPSTITYYITFEMEGDETYLLEVGTAYEEPGVTAFEGTEDVTSSMVTTGSVDENTVGLYTITYSATNQDGFSSSITRTVIVYDPSVTTDISGTYTTASGTYRLLDASGYSDEYIEENNLTVIEYEGARWIQTVFAGYSVTITQLAPGFNSVSDFLGGFYAQRAGYGSSYAMTGYLKVNSDDPLELEIVSAGVAGWGDSYDSVSDIVYDEEAGTISYMMVYAEMPFFVVLTK